VAEPTSESTTPNPQASATPANPSAVAQPNGTPAPAAGEDVAALKAQLDAVLRWKAEAEADLKKGRDARKEIEAKAQAEKAEAEKQLREAGKFAELAKVKEDEAKALAAQMAEFTGKASQYDAITKAMGEKITAAKAKGDLPSYIVKALDASPNPVSALDILDEFRAAQASATPAGKQPAPPAPATGAPAAAQTPKKDVNALTPQEIQNLKPEERAALFGTATTNKGAFASWFGG
jgi:hypothetical protein